MMKAYWHEDIHGKGPCTCERLWIWIDEEKDGSPELHYVQPDIEEFRSSDGALISSRAQWREHLKRNGMIELGRSDLNRMREKWLQRKTDELQLSDNPHVQPSDAPVIEAKITERSRLQKEMMNRLDGRAVPDVRTHLRLGLDLMRAYGEKRK